MSFNPRWSQARGRAAAFLESSPRYEWNSELEPQSYSGAGSYLGGRGGDLEQLVTAMPAVPGRGNDYSPLTDAISDRNMNALSQGISTAMEQAGLAQGLAQQSFSQGQNLLYTGERQAWDLDMREMANEYQEKIAKAQSRGGGLLGGLFG